MDGKYLLYGRNPRFFELWHVLGYKLSFNNRQLCWYFCCPDFINSELFGGCIPIGGKVGHLLLFIGNIQ